MTVFSALEAAINDLAVVEIGYDGTMRVIEPHLIGRNKKGNVCLSAFQLSGGSGVSFRAFMLEKMVSVTPTGDFFAGPRPSYNPNDQTMLEVFVSL